MKRFICKKFIFVFLSTLVGLILITNVVCESYFYRYEKHARVLYDLGLYEGISNTGFEPDLGTAVNRETGIVLLLKLFGKKENVLAMKNDDVDEILSIFRDSYAISRWAEKYIAYAIKNGMVNGITTNTISPKQALDGKTYATMILRNLGYEISKDKWEIASQILAYLDGLSVREAKEFNEKLLVKDELVAISFRALGAKGIDSEYLITKLINDGVLSKKTAIRLDMVETVKNKLVPTDKINFSEELTQERQRIVLGDGTLFEGEIRNGKANGYGTMVYPGNIKYSGTFEDNRKHGRGVFIWPNGDRYEGEFIYDHMTGYGNFTWTNGDRYEGNWYQGAFNGNGTFIWASSDQYSGEWSEGKFNGFGTFSKSNGESHTGYYSAGKKDGKGTYRHYDGTEQRGYWSEDKFVREGE